MWIPFDRWQEWRMKSLFDRWQESLFDRWRLGSTRPARHGELHIMHIMQYIRADDTWNSVDDVNGDDSSMDRWQHRRSFVR